MKNKMMIPIILCGVFLVGVMLSLCGLGLSMGFKKLSLAGFFGALVILAVLRIIAWLNTRRDGA